MVRTNEEVAEYAQWLQSTGRKVLKLDRNTQDDDSHPGVRVATMHRVKGLEFDGVIVAGYRSPEHYAEVYGAEADAGVLLDNLSQRPLPVARCGDASEALLNGEPAGSAG